jgi:predicted nucleic acid-binding protein
VRVIDASVLVTVLAGVTSRAMSVRARLHDDTIAAPHLVDLEVLHALRGLVLGGRLGPPDVDAAVRRLRRLPLARHAHQPLIGRCWELRHNLTAYDASYVALAEALGVPLLTADARLADAPGIRCDVELLT